MIYKIISNNKQITKITKYPETNQNQRRSQSTTKT